MLKIYKWINKYIKNNMLVELILMLIFSLVVMATGKALPTARVWFAVWRQLLRRWLDDGPKLLLLAANLLHVLWRQCFCVSREATLLSGCTARDWHHYETQGHIWSIQVGSVIPLVVSDLSLPRALHRINPGSRRGGSRITCMRMLRNLYLA